MSRTECQEKIFSLDDVHECVWKIGSAKKTRKKLDIA